MIKNKTHFVLTLVLIQVFVALTIGILYFSLRRKPVMPEEVQTAIEKISDFPQGLTISQFASRLFQLGLIESLERYHFKDFVHSWELKTNGSTGKFIVSGDFYPNGVRIVSITNLQESWTTVATIELKEKMVQEKMIQNDKNP